MATVKLKVGDRVKRKEIPSCHGTVKAMRHEAANKAKDKDKTMIISVFWDNGTQSFFGAEGLELSNS